MPDGDIFGLKSGNLGGDSKWDTVHCNLWSVSRDSYTLQVYFQYTAFRLDPVGETGLSHRLTAYKIVGHFYGLSYLKILGNNQVENIF